MSKNGKAEIKKSNIDMIHKESALSMVVRMTLDESDEGVELKIFNFSGGEETKL